MSLSHEHIQPKTSAKIEIYTLSRAELLCSICYKIPCTYTYTIIRDFLSLILMDLQKLQMVLNFKWNFNKALTPL